MRVVILGAGGVGSVVGAHLAQAGHDVLLIGRPGHVQAIAERGLEITGARSMRVRVPAAVDGSELDECDLLVVTCKTPDTGDALESVAHVRVGLSCSLQNGVVKDRALADAFGPDRVLGACTMIGAARLADGVVHFTLDDETFFGEPHGPVSDRVQRVVDAFVESGLGAKAADDVASYEWTKQVLQCASAPVSALTRLPMHAIWGNRLLAELTVSILREATAVARANGIELTTHPGFGFDLRTLDQVPFEQAVGLVMQRGEAVRARGHTNILTSMLQDVQAGRRTEIEETVGHVVREAGRLGVPVPRTELLYKAVRGIELARHQQAGSGGQGS